ncbi:hypothetical protein CEJ39_22530 [Rhodococcus pyridinivorans]|uniref:hypothetical protein n=1 Tax=Rhodococcus pyridinivorans TaxID=103816 RepID=UPI000DCACB80|nr:hypothetical protein [Rhodococcus pyridinivorans]AWZ26585.1 hypothetical protein CEJ39_22530 [Rhodococcus pyridinivorans]
MTGELWHHLAAQVEQLDAQAGRLIRRALTEHTAALRVQVAGRAGTGRESVETQVRELLLRRVDIEGGQVDAAVGGVVVDTPDGPDPVLDGDVVVYVVPRRLDPAVAHPADRAALTAVDPCRLVLVVTGGTDDSECALVARATGVPPDQVVAVRDEELLGERLAARAVVARRLRDEELARVVAGVPAAPQVRELVEQTLDLVGLDPMESVAAGLR